MRRCDPVASFAILGRAVVIGVTQSKTGLDSR